MRYTSIIKLNNENVNFYLFLHQLKTVITTSTGLYANCIYFFYSDTFD